LAYWARSTKSFTALYEFGIAAGDARSVTSGGTSSDGEDSSVIKAIDGKWVA
jgi:hypothetical protein